MSDLNLIMLVAENFLAASSGNSIEPCDSLKMSSYLFLHAGAVESLGSGLISK
jgi:hypothetical protein